jgi:carbonic anhydrase
MCKLCNVSRRSVLGGFAATLVAAAGPAPASSISGDEALKRLMDGNALYRANKMSLRDYAANRASQVKIHRPIASILSCSDARVSPELLFDQGPGDLFVVRVAGNILEGDGLASLEYAAQFLGCPLIFVMGHSNCGAVAAAVEAVEHNTTLPGHLPELIDQVKPAVLAAQATHPADLLKASILENVRRTQQAVASAQPLLAGLVSSGKVKVAAGVYDIATGGVTLV